MIRGFVSRPLVYKISKQWEKIQKSIHVLYVGDHDPSGRSIEDDIKEKLRRELDKKG